MRKNVYEERQNQLRWQVKLGDTPMSNSDRESALAERANAWNIYKVCVVIIPKSIRVNIKCI